MFEIKILFFDIHDVLHITILWLNLQQLNNEAFVIISGLVKTSILKKTEMGTFHLYTFQEIYNVLQDIRKG